jgi:hypothetical protein
MKMCRMKVFGIDRIWWADPNSSKPVHVATDRDGRSVWMVSSYSAKRQRFSFRRLGCWVRGLCLGALAATRRGGLLTGGPGW